MHSTARGPRPIWSAAPWPESHTDLGGDGSRQGCKTAYVHCDSNTEKRDAAPLSGLTDWCVPPGHRTRDSGVIVPPGPRGPRGGGGGGGGGLSAEEESDFSATVPAWESAANRFSWRLMLIGPGPQNP